MQTTLNWGKLVAQGRAKDVGISWSTEERNAIHILKIPADYVRDGIITLDDYSKALEKEARDGKPLDRESREELEAKAIELGVAIHPDTPKSALVLEIKKRVLKKEQAAKQIKLVEEAKAKFAKEAANIKAKTELDKEEAKLKIKDKIDKNLEKNLFKMNEKVSDKVEDIIEEKEAIMQKADSKKDNK